MDWFTWLAAGGVGSILLWLVGTRAARWLRHRRLRSAPFPAAWQKLLYRRVALYRRLPERWRRRLHGLILIFLAEKNFEGCGGLELDDEIRVTIAAQACLLIMRRPQGVYPKLYSVLVYPGAYLNRQDGGSGTVLAGESWTSGTVVLAWDHIRENALDPQTDNVVLHEFAHQLDQEDGAGDGVPILDENTAYAAWARICRRGFADLQKRARVGRKSLLDKYGATNPAEFFAVATETFFEKSDRLAARDPELYGMLRTYYGLDPALWEEEPEP